VVTHTRGVYLGVILTPNHRGASPFLDFVQARTRCEKQQPKCACDKTTGR